ncbi:hypothetical protein HDG38_007018 [Paraburkholderia sp. WSM4177]|nr:hypothetical protein [Paraburkholderia sp. WSM4177]MBB5488751.1 hypothetical protein [Paraburkholderia sp. WSM4180]
MSYVGAHRIANNIATLSAGKCDRLASDQFERVGIIPVQALKARLACKIDAIGARRSVTPAFEAQRITLVMDNLNTHTAAALYETFPPSQAKALWDRFEFVYTPKHRSWLNMAEIELDVMIKQCLARRIRIAAMENVLDIYHRPYDAAHPVVCMDETPRQLISQTREPIKAAPGRLAREDYEYERCGVCNVFMASEPLAGRRFTKVTESRTKVQWARFVQDIAHAYELRICLRRDDPAYFSPGL